MASRSEEKERRREERQRAELTAAEQERRQRLVKLVSAAVFIALIAVVVAIVVSQSGDDSGGGGDPNLTGVAKVEAQLRGLPQNGAVLGDPSASKTLIEYGDLQCPVCKLYSEQVLPRFFSNQVRDGEVKIEFRPWVIIGPDSTPASEAAYAAGEQGRFWSFIELFYRNQGEENGGYVTDDFLTSIAKGAGVKDIARWNSDRKDSRWKRELSRNDASAAAFGFMGTPSFAIQSDGGQAEPIGQSGSATSPGQIAAAISGG